MPKKTLQTSYKGRDIRVVNTWFNGLTLYVDDKEHCFIDKTLHLDRDDPVISTSITTIDGIEPLEVFVEAIVTVKILIQIGGKTVARSDQAA